MQRGGKRGGWKHRLYGLSHAEESGFYFRGPNRVDCFAEDRTQPQPCGDPWGSILDVPPVPQTGRTRPLATILMFCCFYFLPPHCQLPAGCLRRCRRSIKASHGASSPGGLPFALAAPSCLLAASGLHQPSLEGGKVTPRHPSDG